MPRGGARVGAGRKPHAEPKQRKSRAKAAPAGYSPDGKKAEDAPRNWPFGTAEPTASAEGAPPDKPASADGDEPVISAKTPLEFLLAVISAEHLKLPLRLQAAALAAPFVHAKPAPVGKKEQRQEAAGKAGGVSKFAPAAAPRLVSSR